MTDEMELGEKQRLEQGIGVRKSGYMEGNNH